MSDADEKLRAAIEAAARALWATRTSERWDERLLEFPDSQDIGKARADAHAILSASGLLARLAAVEAERDELREDLAEVRESYATAAQYYSLFHDAARGRDEALAELDQARQALQRVKALRDRWNEVRWDFEDAPACVGQQYELFSELSAALAGPVGVPAEQPEQTTAYEACSSCGGSGMQDHLNGVGECYTCGGDTVVRARDETGKFTTLPVAADLMDRPIPSVAVTESFDHGLAADPQED